MSPGLRVQAAPGAAKAPPGAAEADRDCGWSSTFVVFFFFLSLFFSWVGFVLFSFLFCFVSLRKTFTGAKSRWLPCPRAGAFL